jgi:hypothetical protein
MNLDFNGTLLLIIHQEPHLKGLKKYGVVIVVSNDMISILSRIKLSSFIKKLFQ